jgi:hypothetical protein
MKFQEQLGNKHYYNYIPYQHDKNILAKNINLSIPTFINMVDMNFNQQLQLEED